MVRKPSEPKATYGAENGGVSFKPSTSQKKIVSVLPALCKTFAPEFLLGSLLKLMQDLLAFVSPQILRFSHFYSSAFSFAITITFVLSLLIGFVEDTTQESWKGYLYAIILTLTAMLQTVILGQYFQRMFVIGMQIRTSIVSSIYRKVPLSLLFDPIRCVIGIFYACRLLEFPIVLAKNQLSEKLSIWCRWMPSGSWI